MTVVIKAAVIIIFSWYFALIGRTWAEPSHILIFLNFHVCFYTPYARLYGFHTPFNITRFDNTQQTRRKRMVIKIPPVPWARVHSQNPIPFCRQIMKRFYIPAFSKIASTFDLKFNQTLTFFFLSVSNPDSFKRKCSACSCFSVFVFLLLCFSCLHCSTLELCLYSRPLDFPTLS